MATEITGKGDQQRSLDLLWGTAKAPTRGPKPALSVDQIVHAAIEVADTDGMAALSMRRVADNIGVGAMSPYTYIPGKAGLLNTVFTEEALPDAVKGDWRAHLALYACENWALYQGHPRVLQVSGVRTWLGPNELAPFGAALASVAELGLNAREMFSVVNPTGGYVNGTARAASAPNQATQRTGETDNKWWNARESILTKYFDPERYSTSDAVHTMGSFDTADGGQEYNAQNAVDDFAFGLQRVLNGVEVFIQRRQAEQPAR